ncbi:MAG: hypothetical protein R3E32_18225 [Chitinophagales bacterium]
MNIFCKIALLGILLYLFHGCQLMQQEENPYCTSGKLTIEVTGKKYNWYYRFAGLDQTLHTEDDIISKNEIHVPTYTSIELVFKSEDYLYFFKIPELEQAQIAVPDLTHVLNFQTYSSMSYTIKGDQLCGFSHTSLFGELVVEKPSKFILWLQNIASQKIDIHNEQETFYN